MAETREHIVSESVRTSKDHRARRLLLILAVLMLLLAGYTAWSNEEINDLKDQKISQGKSLAEQVREACEESKPNPDLDALCQRADKVIEKIEGEPGPAGPAGPAGDDAPPPSDEQVALAISSYCAGGACRGASVTPLQVSAAVAKYCNARGKCKGPAGATGAAGPPPSDLQVASAVSTYCNSHNECKAAAIPPDGNVTAGTCELAFLSIGKPEAEGVVTGRIVLTIQQGSTTRQVTIRC